jgi:putative transposase
MTEAPTTADRSRKRPVGAPTHVITMPLHTHPGDDRILTAKFHAGTRLYNAILGETLARSAKLRRDPGFIAAKAMPQGQKIGGKWDQAHKGRVEAFTAVEARRGFSESGVQAFARDCRRAFCSELLGAHEVQVIAKQAWNAGSGYHYGKRGRPRFKSVTHDLARGVRSLSGKDLQSTIRVHRDALTGEVLGIRMGDPRRGGLVLNFPALRTGPGRRAREEQDKRAHLNEVASDLGGLLSTRIVRKRRGNRWLYEAHFVVDGHPPQRHTPATSGVAGLDFGPSNVGVTFLDENTGQWTGEVVPIAPGIDDIHARLRREQRHLDRQHRAGSPACFRTDGTHKRGRCAWTPSQRAVKTKARIAELHRRESEHRKTLHGTFVNHVTSHACEIRLEDVSYTAWAKTYPHATRTHGVGTAVSALRGKAESAGHRMVEINTWQTALSQHCVCGVRKKKTLGERTHVCDSCGLRQQRDILSAFLGMCVDRTLDESTGELVDLLNLEHAKDLYPRQGECFPAFPRHDTAVGRGSSSTHKRQVRRRPSRRSRERIAARHQQVCASVRQSRSTEKTRPGGPTVTETAKETSWTLE